MDQLHKHETWYMQASTHASIALIHINRMKKCIFLESQDASSKRLLSSSRAKALSSELHAIYESLEDIEIPMKCPAGD